MSADALAEPHSGQAELDSLLRRHGVVPVGGGFGSPDAARRLAAALIDGGLPLIEVTLRTPTALEELRVLAEVDGLLVGAGTVRTAAQLYAAVEAGAAFVVSPCLTPELAEAARATGIPFLPGAVTASEIQTAVDAGYTTVKFFPAEASGGVSALKALAEPFYDVTFVPTGGITQASAPTYLAHRSIAAVGGGWMLPPAPREARDWAEVTRHIAAAREIAERST